MKDNPKSNTASEQKKNSYLSMKLCWNEEGLCEATGYTREELWKHFSLDDWDYAIICYEDEYNDWSNAWIDLEGLLHGPCSNEVYKIPCLNQLRSMLVGVAYHA